MNEEEELNRRLASMAPDYTSSIPVDDKSTQVTTQKPGDVKPITSMRESLEKILKDEAAKVTKPADLERIKAIYKSYIPEKTELPEEEEGQSIWKTLGIALGPAILGAALGRDPLGRAMGLTAGASAGKEYAEAVSKRAEKKEERRSELFKELNKRREELRLEAMKKQADAEIKAMELAQKASEDSALTKARGGALQRLYIEEALGKAVPGQKVVTTEKPAKPEIVINTLVPGVTWNKKYDISLQNTPSGQKSLNDAKGIVSQYSDLDTSIEAYQKLLKEGKGTVDPTSKLGTEIALRYKDLLLKAKEAYNLGVLNGGDLQQLEAIIPVSLFSLEDEGFIKRALQLSTNKFKAGNVEIFRNMMRESMQRKLDPHGWTVNLPKKIQMTPEQAKMYEKEKQKAAGGLK